MQSDGVARTLLSLLLGMSVASWYVIVTRLWRAARARRESASFLGTFWQLPSLPSVAAHIEQHPPAEPFAQLARQGLAATRQRSMVEASRLEEAGTFPDFLTRALRRAIDEETARLESGLTLLASVGSTAPFIGLFGTVWGVYHALAGIGLSGQATLDQVAGPVGEALIMTALGLAVAIPAVLGYNACVRANRVLLARLDSFAHDLFALFTMGAPAGRAA